MILFSISFIAGVLTAIAPCVLPLLPVIVGGSIASSSAQGSGRTRAVTIAASLGISVVIFTLLLKASTAFINVPQSTWEWISGAILIVFGLVMLFPQIWDRLGFVNALNRSSNKLLATGYQQNSFWGDALMGAALGPVFSSCSPTYFVILATVLPASFAMGFADLLAYALGLSGFLLVIALVGQRLVDKLGVAIEPGGWFRRGIGVLFLIVGLAVATGAEVSAEKWLLNHGFDLTFIEQRLLGAPQGSGVTIPTQTSSATSSSTLLSPQMKAGTFHKAPELASIDGYINTGGQPITIGQFRGNKVVLIDIWTYSCINCQRTLPYIKMWYDKYSDQGLEIIGVHTPEFAFEHLLANVQTAVNGSGIKYPVVLDNEYATWNAFGNQFWPRKYLIDIDGYIVYDHAGEGNYDETEAAIQKVLAERATRLGTPMPSEGGTTAAPSGVVTVDQRQLGSPETYFGAARNEYLGNGQPGTGGTQSLGEPITVEPNKLYLIGTWDIEQEYAQTPAQVGGPLGSDRIDYRYRAKNVYLVAGSATGANIDVEVLRDSKPLDASSAGADVHFKNGKSYITVTDDRLYKVIEDPAYGDHFLELIISQPGLQVYTFTFG